MLPTIGLVSGVDMHCTWLTVNVDVEDLPSTVVLFIQGREFVPDDD